MNPYYHSFSVGFNFWMLTVPMVIVFAFFLGKKQYHYSKRNCKIERYISKKTYKVISGVFAVLLTIQIYAESMRGITQVFDNSLTKLDSPLLSDTLAGLTVVPIVICLGILIYGSSALGGKIKQYHLKH